MSSNTAIRFEPTTVILRILCGSSHDRCRCADLPGGEAQVAEHDVLDAGLQVALAARRHLDRARSPSRYSTTEMSCDAEAPERVLVLADLAQVLPVAVHVEDLAELAGVDQLLQLRPRRVEASRWPTISTRSRLAASAASSRASAAVRPAASRRSTCLPACSACAPSACVRGHRRRHHDGVERVVLEQVVERGVIRTLGNCAENRARRSSSRSQHQAQVGSPGIGPKFRAQVRAPVAEPDDADRDTALASQPRAPSLAVGARSRCGSRTPAARARPRAVVDRRSGRSRCTTMSESSTASVVERHDRRSRPSGRASGTCGSW